MLEGRISIVSLYAYRVLIETYYERLSDPLSFSLHLMVVENTVDYLHYRCLGTGPEP